MAHDSPHGAVAHRWAGIFPRDRPRSSPWVTCERYRDSQRKRGGGAEGKEYPIATFRRCWRRVSVGWVFEVVLFYSLNLPSHFLKKLNATAN
jgi:hypothetical protein